MTPEPFREIPAGGVAGGSITAPPSKSHAVRALICACLADGTSRLTGLPAADDILHATRALCALGFDIDETEPGAVVVNGSGGIIPNDRAELDVGGSGTALRLLTAVCAMGPGPYTIDGDRSLRGRPLGSVAAALEQIGARVETTDGRPPIVVRGGTLRGETTVAVDVSQSSQPLSALLLLAPVVPGGLNLRADGPAVSVGYVVLTVQTLLQFGAPTVRSRDRGGGYTIAARGGGYRALDLAIEGDWSSAAFLLALGPATGGRVTVEGLSESAQPDRGIEGVLRRMGADVEGSQDGTTASGRLTRPITVDLGASPDLAPLVGALACLVPGETVVRGAAHLRIKETDRIAAVVNAARALGCRAEERPDGFAIEGPAQHGGSIDPAGDHRIAMAFAVAGAAIPGVRIDDPGCVAKSFPDFWESLSTLVPHP